MLARAVCIHIGSTKSPSEIAKASGGMPARIVAMSLGEIETVSERVRGEEIDLAPLLLLAMAGTVALRYIGSGLGEIDLYMLGGIGTAGFLFFRYFLMRGMSKG